MKICIILSIRDLKKEPLISSYFILLIKEFGLYSYVAYTEVPHRYIIILYYKL